MVDHFHHSHFELENREIAKEAVKQSGNNDERLDKLELQVNSLSIISEALYEIIASKMNLAPAELSAAINLVVANRAERRDAKSTCVSCNRLVPSNKHKCIYCGGQLLGEIKVSPFDYNL